MIYLKVSFKKKIYTASGLIVAGQWLSLLGLSLYILEEFGQLWFSGLYSLGIIFSFLLINSIQNKFFSGKKADAIYLRIIHIILIIVLLFFDINIYSLIIYFSLMNTVTQLNSGCVSQLIRTHCEPFEQRDVIKRISAQRAVLGIISPFIGGVFYTYTSLINILFIEFVLVLMAIFVLVSINEKSISLTEIIPSYENLIKFKNSSEFKSLSVYLSVFLFIGILHMYMQYPFLKERNWTPIMISIITSMWGLGGALNLFFTAFDKDFSMKKPSIIFSLMFIIFMYTQSFIIASIVMMIAGFMYVHIMSLMRYNAMAITPHYTTTVYVWSSLMRRAYFFQIIPALCLPFMVNAGGLIYIKWAMIGSLLFFSGVGFFDKKREV